MQARWLARMANSRRLHQQTKTTPSRCRFCLLGFDCTGIESAPGNKWLLRHQSVERKLPRKFQLAVNAYDMVGQPGIDRRKRNLTFLPEDFRYPCVM